MHVQPFINHERDSTEKQTKETLQFISISKKSEMNKVEKFLTSELILVVGSDPLLGIGGGGGGGGGGGAPIPWKDPPSTTNCLHRSVAEQCHRASVKPRQDVQWQDSFTCCDGLSHGWGGCNSRNAANLGWLLTAWTQMKENKQIWSSKCVKIVSVFRIRFILARQDS